MRLGIIIEGLKELAKKDNKEALHAIEELHDIVVRIKDVDEEWLDDVTVIPHMSLFFALYPLTYDVYGRAAKQSSNGHVVLEDYVKLVHDQVDACKAMPPSQLIDVHEMVTDMWRDKEARGENNEDGTAK